MKREHEAQGRRCKLRCENMCPCPVLSVGKTFQSLDTSPRLKLCSRRWNWQSKFNFSCDLQVGQGARSRSKHSWLTAGKQPQGKVLVDSIECFPVFTPCYPEIWELARSHHHHALCCFSSLCFRENSVLLKEFPLCVVFVPCPTLLENLFLQVHKSELLPTPSPCFSLLLVPFVPQFPFFHTVSDMYIILYVYKI